MKVSGRDDLQGESVCATAPLSLVTSTQHVAARVDSAAESLLSTSQKRGTAEALRSVLKTSKCETGSLAGACAHLNSHAWAIRLGLIQDALINAINVAASVAVVIDDWLVGPTRTAGGEDGQMVLATARIAGALCTGAFEIAVAVGTLAAARLQTETAVALSAVLDAGEGVALAAAVDHAGTLGHAGVVGVFVARQGAVRNGVGVAAIVGPSAWKDGSRTQVGAGVVRGRSQLRGGSQHECSE